MCDPHRWVLTGRVDHHAISEDSEGRPLLPVVFLRCADCRQNGFQKQTSRVIYTWRSEDA